MKHLIIIGVGGYAREVYWHAQGCRGFGEEWDLKGFLDGDVRLDEREYEKLCLPLLGDVNDYIPEEDDVFICAIANPSVKKKLIQAILEKDGKFINLIHRTALIHGNVQMGTGNIVGHFVTLNDHAVIGNYVTFNGRAGMAHDSSIGDYSTLSGVVSINGFASVGSGTFWGANSIALPNSRVEDDAFIGVASVVFKHVWKGQKVFGNPAMPI